MGGGGGGGGNPKKIIPRKKLGKKNFPGIVQKNPSLEDRPIKFT